MKGGLLNWRNSASLGLIKVKVYKAVSESQENWKITNA